MAKNRNKKQNTVNNSSNTVNNGLANALGIPDGFQPAPLYDLGGQDITPFYITFWWPLLTNAYKSLAFVQLAVNQIVDDAFRNEGLIIDSKTLESDELEKLRTVVYDEDIEAIKDCIRWGLLYGGGVLIANTNQNNERPLIEQNLQDKKLVFLASDRWHCFPEKNGNIKVAQTWLYTNETGVAEAAQFRADSSRINFFTGMSTPIYIRNIMGGWGLSIFEAILKPLRQYIKAMNVSLELLDEAKIDIIKIFDLTSTLLSGNDSLIRKRLQLVTENKNYKSSIAMDVQDDYQQKQISFSGLPEMIVQIQYLVCAALKRPYSKIFGKGSSGFSSGEDDLENYNATVDSEIRTPATKLIKWVIQLRCWQLFGRELPDLKIDWKPLRVMSEKDEAEIKSKKLADYLQLFDRQLLTPRQVAEHLTDDGIVLYSEEEISEIENAFNPDNYNSAEDLLIDKNYV